MITKWKTLAYLLLAAAALSGAALALGKLYREGSSAVPLWPQFIRPGDLSSRHAFLSEKCETCHTPTRGVEASACISCHATDAAVLAREDTAFHATVQSCAGCHVEHQGGSRPTRMDHQVLVQIGEAKTGKPSASWPWRAFSRLPQARDSLDCLSCHSNRSPHRDLFGKECAACHSTETWKIAGYQHPSPASTDCAQCHQAPPSHYMGHFHMISKMVARKEHARVEQCYLCHQTDAWNDIKGAGWYKHH